MAAQQPRTQTPMPDTWTLHQDDFQTLVDASKAYFGLYGSGLWFWRCDISGIATRARPNKSSLVAENFAVAQF